MGCHSDAYEQAHWFGDDIAAKSVKYEHQSSTLADLALTLRMLGAGSTPLHRLRVAVDFVLSGYKELDGMIANHTLIARALGRELGLPPSTLDALGASYERWDGHGWPGNLAGATIPVAARIVQLSEFVEVAHRNGGADAAVEMAERRSAKQFDPDLVRRFSRDVDKVFHGIDELDAWDSSVVDGEPALAVRLSPERCEEALAAIAHARRPQVAVHARALGGAR